MSERERLIAAFQTVLSNPAGFGIESRADLWIDRIDDGRFRVARTYGTKAFLDQELFNSAHEAIARYLERYDQLQMRLVDDAQS